MNETDKEIIAILKETFRKPKVGEWIDPDDLLKSQILKMLLVFSVLGTILVMITKFSDGDSSALGTMVSSVIALFFGALFLHINSKSKNTSLIVFALTWVSMVIGLYVGNS